MTSRRGSWIVVLLLAAASVGAGWGFGVWRHRRAGPSTPLDRGRVAFQINCASCHGPDGKGNGIASANLRPPPRDFAYRPWRFPVTRESIRRVTLEGIPGTSMPAGKSLLAESDVEPLVEFVYGLATRAPAQVRPINAEERLLDDAGFTSLASAEPPKLTLVDADGKTKSLDDWAGKLTLLHFWGTGCAPCVKEMPRLAELEKRDKSLAVVHVCVDEDDPAIAQKTLDRVIPGTTGYIEAAGLGIARFEVSIVPTVWLISPTGKAIARAGGVQDWDSPAIAALLKRYRP